MGGVVVSYFVAQVVSWPGPSGAFQLLAQVILAASFGLVIWSAVYFGRAKTPILPNQVPETLITNGPYRLSRNPIYLVMALGLIAVALWLGSLAAFVSLPIFVWLVTQGHIKEEEEALVETFGPDAEAFFQRTRRWI